MKIANFSRPAAALCALVLVPSAFSDLIHRYSFSTNANDSVGTAHGVAVQRSDAGTPLGSPVSFDGTRAVLDGLGGYIDLPNGMFSQLTNMTIEAWVTWDGGGAWQRIFDFGNSTSGEDTDGSATIGTGDRYMFMSPNGAGTGALRFAITDASNGGERPILNDPNQFPVGSEVYVALTYGPGGARLYVNGQFVASGDAPVPLSALADVNNWLGRSNWPDPMYAGSFNEFRVHNNILNSLQIKASSGAGPDTVNYDPGTLSDLTFTVESTAVVGQTLIPQITATYSGIVGPVQLAGSDVTITSSATNVVQVTPTGNLLATGLGSATITVARDGRTATATIAVSPAAPAELKHRYSFSEPAGSTTVNDSVGDADGEVRPPFDTGAPLQFANNQLQFPGGTYQTAGYVALPGGLISSKTNITIELWTTWNGPANANWQRIFDFGDSQKGQDAQLPGNGLGYLFLTPRAGATGNPLRFAARPNATTAETTLNGPAALAVGQEAHIVVVYAPDYRNSRLYLNGVRLAQGDAPFALNTLADPNNWLGASQYNDPPFNGSINELRIYEGPLTDLQVSLSGVAGPNTIAANPGTLQAIEISAPLLYVGNPATVPAALLANFQNVSNVNVTTVAGATLTSSDTNIFTINATGGLSARAAGTASLIGNFQGLNATNTITVALPNAIRFDMTNTLNAGGGPTTATLRADFSDATNVNVTGFAGISRSSSNPNVATISESGTVVPLRPGMTTISSSYGGLTTEKQLTVVQVPGQQSGTLIHRYSFNEPAGTSTVDDSVGTADGEFVTAGDAAAFNGTGQLSLVGGAWNASPLPSYVNLPNNLVSPLTSVTIEGWATWRAGANFERVFDFGMSSGTPDGASFLEDSVLNPGRAYMFLTPRGGNPAVARFAIKEGTAAETPNLAGNAAFNTNAPTHFALVYNYPAGGVVLYLNGQRAGTATATLPLSVLDDRNMWLGRSNWQDPFFNGLLDEFRIYNGVRSDDEVAASFAAGPNALPDSTPRPTLGISLSAGTINITWPVTATGFQLQTTATIDDETWDPVNTAPTADGGNLRVSIPVGTGTAFFRLSK